MLSKRQALTLLKQCQNIVEQEGKISFVEGLFQSLSFYLVCFAFIVAGLVLIFFSKNIDVGIAFLGLGIGALARNIGVVIQSRAFWPLFVKIIDKDKIKKLIQNYK